MTANSLIPTICLPTKLNSRSSTLIDNIFTNQFNPDTTSGNFTIEISDHLPSFVIIPNSNQQHLPKKHNLFKRDIKNVNYNDLQQEVNQINWTNTLQTEKDDANLSFDSFYESINSIIDKHMPLRKLTKNGHKQKFKTLGN